MGKLATVQKISLPPDKRVIVISDIHGNLPYLQGLLRKIQFCVEDILILLGDLFEKGKSSLDTYEYLRQLEKDYTVYFLPGNYEELLRQFFNGETQGHGFLSKYLTYNPNSLIFQSTKTQWVKYRHDLKGLQKKATAQKEIAQWLQAMPTMLESDDYLFVHGGVPHLHRLETLDHWRCLKKDNFLKKDTDFHKYVVVGHTPTTLYSTDMQSANPIILEDRKIISIDGGCVLKRDGQLNAVFLQNGQISFDYYDNLPLVQVKSSQQASTHNLNIRWGRAEVTVLDFQGEFARCLHHESQEEILILRKFFKTHASVGGLATCHDSTNYLLPVEEGEIISLSESVSGGFLGKKQGVTGWYFGDYTRITP